MTGPGIDCAFFDSGSLDTNGWAFGRDDSIPMRFWVVTDNGNKSNMCGFPQDSIGSDSGFHAWGISLGIVGTTLWGTNYYDGVAVATNSTGPVSRLTIAETYKWLAIGRRKHGHTTDPDVSPDTPNGFVFGPMADPRIYDRALSGAEQLAVFQNQPTQGGGGGGGGGSPTNSFPSRLKGKIRIRGSGTIK
jgi:hypothetical protein